MSKNRELAELGDKVTVDSGNVGIGTTSPNNALHIKADQPIIKLEDNQAGGGYHQLSNSNSDGTLVIYADADGTNSSTANMRLSVGGTERMRIDSSGNVGIGTSSPNANLSLGSGVDAQKLALYDANNNYKYGFGIQANELRTYCPSDAHISFGTISKSDGSTWSEKMRIDSTGRLMTGVTNPSAKHHFDNTTDSNGLFVDCYQHNVSGDTGIYTRIGSNCNNTSSHHFRGTTHGVNNWYLHGNGTTSYSSDERLKKNIETTRDGYLDDLAQLRVVKYHWYTQEDDEAKELGLIAQEVEEIFPSLIEEHELDGLDEEDNVRKNIKHSVMEFILIKALQEAKTKIDTLETTVADLTTRIEALENV